MIPLARKSVLNQGHIVGFLPIWCPFRNGLFRPGSRKAKNLTRWNLLISGDHCGKEGSDLVGYGAENGGFPDSGQYAGFLATRNCISPDKPRVARK